MESCTKCQRSTVPGGAGEIEEVTFDQGLGKGLGFLATSAN